MAKQNPDRATPLNPRCQKVTVPENQTNRKEYKVSVHWSRALIAVFQGTGGKRCDRLSKMVLSQI